MLIRLSQSGGFAGIPIELAQVDTAELPRERAQRLAQLAQAVLDDADETDASAQQRVGADTDVRYTLTIENRGKSRTVSFPDTGGGVTTAARGNVRELVSAILDNGPR